MICLMSAMLLDLELFNENEITCFYRMVELPRFFSYLSLAMDCWLLAESSTKMCKEICVKFTLFLRPKMTGFSAAVEVFKRCFMKFFILFYFV